jgi:hypothetical protein
MSVAGRMFQRDGTDAASSSVISGVTPTDVIASRTARDRSEADRRAERGTSWNRRAFLTQLMVWGAGASHAARRTHARGYFTRNDDHMLSSDADQAVQQGLDLLAARQTEEGSFAGDGYRRNVAVISLAAMAFLARGSTVGRGPHGLHLSRSVRYILRHAQDSGFIAAPGSTSHGPMYGHGFATLLLADVYGSWPDGELREKLVRAVRLIVQTQNDEGGWRYQPERGDADISVTVCQVMALRAARNAGLFVPNETIDRCTEYVLQRQNPDGGFAYMASDRESRFPRSAAAVVALYSAGVYEGETIRRGLEYLRQHQPQPGINSLENHFFYGHYYAVQAMWHAGGDDWRNWYPAIRDTLLARRTGDGSWFDQICPEYGTAMACLILQMPRNYLPIFQR